MFGVLMIVIVTAKTELAQALKLLLQPQVQSPALSPWLPQLSTQ